MQRISIDEKQTSINENWSLGRVSYEISIPAGVLEDQTGDSKGKLNSKLRIIFKKKNNIVN